jgi:hypothetical protein
MEKVFAEEVKGKSGHRCTVEGSTSISDVMLLLFGGVLLGGPLSALPNRNAHGSFQVVPPNREKLCTTYQQPPHTRLTAPSCSNTLDTTTSRRTVPRLPTQHTRALRVSTTYNMAEKPTFKLVLVGDGGTGKVRRHSDLRYGGSATSL